MAHICSECFAETEYLCKGHDSDGKIFRLYSCPDCGSHIREFYAPIEKVSLSANDTSDKPVQTRMFPVARVSD